MQFSDAPASSALTASTPESDFNRKAAQWALIRDRVEAQNRVLDGLKDAMVTDLKNHGVKDDKGSFVIDLGTSYEVAGKSFSAMKYERSVRRAADENVAEELAQKKGLLDRLFPRQRMFDPDEVYVLLQEDLLTEDEVDAIFPEHESFRLVRVGK
ncbi:hypothetical protein [Streptomyces sp. WZ-12]|uniref:hypothetical protein n=1 Tax=Streptomyces sp. WZ-12 TaxID=3030210 RepID=UPI002381159B|nr:hypothetical protein [Streptomyces sp. WZ-12]